MIFLIIIYNKKKKEHFLFFTGKQAIKNINSNNVRELNREKDIVSYTFSDALNSSTINILPHINDFETKIFKKNSKNSNLLLFFFIKRELSI